jgi:hypothetical protein
MSVILETPRGLAYPAIYLCGHSEDVHAWTRAELEYKIRTAARYFCVGCSITTGREFSKQASEEMPWMTWDQKREWVVAQVRAAVLGGRG